MKKISFNTIRQFLIVFIIAVLIVGGVAVATKDKFTSPKNQWYFLKAAGEWIDVNFLTFSAQGKQDKHLRYADRRLEEFLKFIMPEKQCAYQNKRYELELARAYNMAEELALVDPNLRNLMANVYVVTFNQLSRLESFEHPQTPGFIYSAKLYNARAIKTLLQKYQYTPADTASYKDLIELLYDRIAVRSNTLTPEQQQRLSLARGVLDEGVELEWAYDLLIELI